MPTRPQAVAFDVMGTLFPLDPLREPLVGLGLPPQALEIWFARTLRDGFALAAAGPIARSSRSPRGPSRACLPSMAVRTTHRAFQTSWQHWLGSPAAQTPARP